MRHFLTFALLLTITASVCGETTPAAPAAPLRNELGGLIEPAIDWSTYPKPAKTGKITDELKHPKTNAFIMKYLLWAPEKLADKKQMGLLVCFHGFTGNETHFGFAYDAMKAAGLAERYIVISLKSKGAGWAKEDESDVLKTIDWVKSTYPIDPRRVYIWGMSNGGWMVSDFGGKHQDLIAGIVRYCGGTPTAPTVKEAATTQSEYYLVHGDADEAVTVEGSRNLRRNLLSQGYRFIYREIDGAGHVNIIDHREVSQDVCRWLDALRHKQIALQPDEDKFLRQFSDAKKSATLLGSANTWNELLRIGGAPAGQVVARAFKSDSAMVRESAAIACTKTAFAGAETVDGLVKLLDDKSPQVRTAAIAALGVAANWRSEAAQLALGKIALKKKGDLGERGSAATLLAAAVEMPMLGNFDDDMASFQAITGLLDADEKSLRDVAFAPLKKAVKDGLGYDPTVTAKERAAAIAKWQQWFTERNKAPPEKTAAR